MAVDFVVIVPALDAESSIGEVVSESLRFTSNLVVIDDGSTDRTAEKAQAAGAFVIRHPRNLGKGAALRTGFEHALNLGAGAVISLDADGQHVPREIPRFIEVWKESSADLIIGSRSHLFKGMLRRRRAANKFSARSISWAAQVAVSDSQSGFRLYSRKLLETVKTEGSGFDAESEVIVLAGRAGLKIESIPIELGFVNGISTSHYRPVADTLKIALTLVRTRFFR